MESASRKSASADEPVELQQQLHDPRVVDARGRLLDTTGMDPRTLSGSVAVMDALFRWREAENRVSEASRRFMRLSPSEMKAVRFLVVAADQERIVTARDLAEHLGISSASTTKLLDRLEAGGHMERRPHPTDRRALALVVAPGTRTAAEATIGAEHARRFRVAADLTARDREVVLAFLSALSRTGEAEWGRSGRSGEEPEPTGTLEE